MNINQIEENLQQLFSSLNRDTFIFDFILSYGLPKASIARLKKGGLNLSKVENEILWKKKLFFKKLDYENIYETFETLKINDKILKHSPRFIIVTNFKTFLSIDTKTKDTIDIPINELIKHFDFFLPLVGMEKAQQQFENPADVKAAERMVKLYDEIKRSNPTETKEQEHNLNVFLSRLLFCFFAEDTGIFDSNQFTNAISSHTQQDGSDLNNYLDKLFEVLNTPYKQRTSLPTYLEAFPYVNGGLFRNKHNAPIFTKSSRQALIDSGTLQWKDINPDIFGSMIQAVVNPEERGGLGMHYTSVPNILKVISPLFLDELYNEYESAKGNIRKLNTLLQRMWNIKLFDPACGSGNFLIIAYKELRCLEMKIFKEIDITNKFHSNQFSGISLSNFYGIELDDFAHEIATLSLWLAEHQMNQEFFAAFGRTKPSLPLKETGNIVQGNACRLDWEIVCQKIEGDEIYIMGNPPYLGFLLQSKEQKEDMQIVFEGYKNFSKLDYISCWFYKASNYIRNCNSFFSFVSTNSLCQGEQVSLLWPLILKSELEIFFAHTSFKWNNNAKQNAGVIVIVVGLRNIKKGEKFIYTKKHIYKVENINAYLASGNNVFVEKRTSSISNLPYMTLGSSPYENGLLLLSPEEKNSLILKYPHSNNFIKRFVGSVEFLRDIEKYCLWIPSELLEEAILIPEIRDRLQKVAEFRGKSGRGKTLETAKTPHEFTENRHQDLPSLIIPIVSSERRDYITCGFIDETNVIPNSARMIYNPETWILSLISSLMHIVWVKMVAGRLKNDFRYSASLCYNSFPFPNISNTQKLELETHVYHILEEREKHSEKTLAQLYDPDQMPEGLREAHRQNDLAVDRCYRSRPFESDEERLEYLFKLYEQMIEDEKNRGTLFSGVAKTKRKLKSK